MDNYQENDLQQTAQAPQPAAPTQPVYTAQPWQQPAYQQPNYQQPMYRQPVYAAPVYQPNTMPVPNSRKPKSRLWKNLLAVVLVITLVTTGCVITGVSVTKYWQKENAARDSALLQSVDERLDRVDATIDEFEQNAGNNAGTNTGNNTDTNTPGVNPTTGMTVAQVYNKNVNSVVTVYCTVSSGFMQGTSQGSGFVLTADGYVATNYHVVEDATSITIKLIDGNEYEATYIGGDQLHDIALIKVDGADLQPVSVGKSEGLTVGDQVVAIGYPLSTEVPVLTVGYISAKDQIVDNGDTTIRMMQTDAAINSGNSGGPLFNMKGEVVGITSAKYSGTSSSGASIEGVGFAIPMDDIIGKFNDLMEKGYISGAYLGISAQSVTPDLANSYGLPVGVYVVSVTNGSCAQKAGIQQEDVIVNLAGYKISSMSDLSTVLQKLEAGQKVTVTVYRPSVDGNVVMNITMDSKPEQ